VKIGDRLNAVSGDTVESLRRAFEIQSRLADREYSTDVVWTEGDRGLPVSPAAQLTSSRRVS
jgi:hypothetical protein